MWGLTNADAMAEERARSSCTTSPVWMQESPVSQEPFTPSSCRLPVWCLAGWGPFSTLVFDERQVSKCLQSWTFPHPCKKINAVALLGCRSSCVMPLCWLRVHPAQAFGMTAVSFLIPLAFSLGKTRSKCWKLRFLFFNFFQCQRWTLIGWTYGWGAAPCMFATCPARKRWLYGTLRQGGELGILGSLLCRPSVPAALQRALVPLASPRSTFFWLLMA